MNQPVNEPVSAATPASPSSQDVDAGAVLRFLDAVEAHPAVQLHSIVLLRHGYEVAAGWWAPYTAPGVQLLYSLSKSFTVTAAALAADEGLLDFGDPLVRYFPELEPQVREPRSRAMTIGAIAAMASGHLTETWEQVSSSDPAEPVKAFLQLPPDREPGTVFAYNQSCTYTLGTIVQRVTGETISGYLRRRLPGVFGDRTLAWQRDDELTGQRELGFTGLHATTSTVARLGQLYLQGGAWEGRQVLPTGWAHDAGRAHVGTRPEVGEQPGPDWAQGYGYQFWVSRHGYRGDGAFGQFCLVLPEHDAVLAITSLCSDTQALLDMVWDHLLPGLRPAGPEGTAPAADQQVADRQVADRQLAERLAALGLPTPPHRLESGPWPQAVLTPRGGTCTAQRTLARVELSVRDGAPVLRLVERGGGHVDAPVGDGCWSVGNGEGPPVACAGGWAAPGHLYCEVLFVETPHRLRLDLRLDGSVFDASWDQAPLRARTLADLGAPRPPRA